MRTFFRLAIGAFLLLSACRPAAAQTFPDDYDGSVPGMAVISNGNQWAAGVKANSPATLGVGLVAVIRGANMNTTADQQFIAPILPGKWVPTSFYAVNCSGTPTTAAGGIYTAASKGGTALVAATQTYAGLTTAATVLALTPASGVATTAIGPTVLYLSLTTAQGTAMTCDFYVVGQGFP